MRLLAILAPLALLMAGCAGPDDSSFPGPYLASNHPTPDGMRLVPDDSDDESWQVFGDAAGLESNPGRVDLEKWGQAERGNVTIDDAWVAIYEAEEPAADDGEDGPGLLIAYAIRFDGAEETLDYLGDYSCFAPSTSVRMVVNDDRAAMLTALGESPVLANAMDELFEDILRETGGRDPCADRDADDE